MKRPASKVVVADTTYESIQDRIIRIKHDLKDLTEFYDIEISPKRTQKLQSFYRDEYESLKNAPFDSYDQDAKIDYLLLQNFLETHSRQLDIKAKEHKDLGTILPFAPSIIELCESRQEMKPLEGAKAASALYSLSQSLTSVQSKIEQHALKTDKLTAFRAAKALRLLSGHLKEWFNYFNRYDPLFSWWVKAPYEKLEKQFVSLESKIREKLVGIAPGDQDTIVGEPIGRDGLLADLSAEKIAYTPEEIIRIGESEYEWCLKEMEAASKDLGYSDWKDALEHVKNCYVEPGKQPQLIRDLALEAEAYVEKHDLVTIPPLAKLWRMFMIPPEVQKVSPFFLGGPYIQVSYPTAEMEHEDKLMSMRGNNPHFSRSTVFHELLPGHHLQYHQTLRHRPYRKLFRTSFWTEGWAFYWELILWDRGFASKPEDKIGMLFWHMHRCIRIVFSLKFHLGLLTPQECVDLLVEKVGHERANAEGEVRRSFNGDYSPLYQVGYMLGALQFYQLRKEMVDTGKVQQKEFHDRIMKAGNMPVEVLRALLTGKKLDHKGFKPEWRFYAKIDEIM
ncbi:hypothetical protein E2P81_ATG08956 [Venturia nashicola]|uniref:X-Pro dipeptidyl-peptidase n=1 Tax=Venturia nashicola TaxID=86259 RepID=A0A4Z1P388_9PEZI|nr:hypothetical protein E6O75_ATG09156 [Venturia nashicola]TLD23612.1 hypothetical protein E2P81_ATG08956 [Venturia nashicola]